MKTLLTLLLLFTITFGLGSSSVHATSTVPEELSYQGELKSTGGTPLSGEFMFRLSLWTSADFDAATDVAGTDIEPAAPNYLGWNEIHTYTVVDGRFALPLGEVTPLPEDIFNQSEIFLQVEIGTTLTNLELVDSRPEPTIDRLKFFSAPYAFNADKLDWRDAGFGANEVPYLDALGKLPVSTIPEGTEEDSFTINTDGDDAKLQFGNNIANAISYIFASDIWDFAAKRLSNIATPTASSDATTKGYVDAAIASVVGGGTPITGIDGETFTLDTNSTANPTDSISLRFGDTINESLIWDGTASQFELSDDVLISGNLVTTGTINGVTIGPKDQVIVLSPGYEGMVFVADGSDNVGGMYEEELLVGANRKNIIKWQSRETSLQDYSAQIRYTLPQDFVSWHATQPISLSYQTELTAADSALDIVVEQEGSATDQLTATGIGLNNTTFTTQDFVLDGATTWAAGDTVLINVKTYSRSQNIATMGDIVLRYTTN